MRARAAAASALVLGALGMLVACAPAVPDDVARGLSVELRQDRTQYADRAATLHVTNGSGEELTLLGAILDAPGFSPSAPDGEPRAHALAPGGGRDVRVRLGEVDCGATGSAGSSTATVTVAPGGTDDDDTTRDDSSAITVAVTDPLDRLAAVRSEACAQRRVAEGATLRLAGVDAVAVGGEPALRITLAVTPVPGGPTVRLVRVAGTTLLSPAAGTPGWSGDDLARRGPDDAVVLDAVPARCDPHAVAEDKRGTFLPVTAEVDDVAQPVIFVPMTDDQRAAAYDLAHDACGWG